MNHALLNRVSFDAINYTENQADQYFVIRTVGYQSQYRCVNRPTSIIGAISISVYAPIFLI